MNEKSILFHFLPQMLEYNDIQHWSLPMIRYIKKHGKFTKCHGSTEIMCILFSVVKNDEKLQNREDTEYLYFRFLPMSAVQILLKIADRQRIEECSSKEHVVNLYSE